MDYGKSFLGLLKKLNLGTLSLKMLPICEVKALRPLSKISGRSGMTANGILYQLEALVPVTSEKESGLLPTPTANTYGSNQGGAQGRTGKKRYSLESMAKMGVLPTPCARDWKDNGCPAEYKRNSLALTAKMLSLPTPTTFDSGGPLPLRKKNPNGGQKPPLVSVIGGKLNPQFVEWMMGYPEDWTKVELKELNN